MDNAADVPVLEEQMDFIALAEGPEAGAAPAPGQLPFVPGANPVFLGHLLPVDAHRRSALPVRILPAGSRISDHDVAEATRCRDRYQRALENASAARAAAQEMQAANAPALEEHELQQSAAYFDASIFHFQVLTAATGPAPPGQVGEGAQALLQLLHQGQLEQAARLRQVLGGQAAQQRLLAEQQRLLAEQQRLLVEQQRELAHLRRRADQQHVMGIDLLFSSLPMQAHAANANARDMFARDPNAGALSPVLPSRERLRFARANAAQLGLDPIEQWHPWAQPYHEMDELKVPPLMAALFPATVADLELLTHRAIIFFELLYGVRLFRERRFARLSVPAEGDARAARRASSHTRAVFFAFICGERMPPL